MTFVGELSLWVALLIAAWGALVSFLGVSRSRDDLIQSGERALHATLVMLLLAAAGLYDAIFSHDFSIAYVASFTTANLPRLYLFASLWAGSAGSMLLWSLALAIVASITVFLGRGRDRSVASYVTGALAIVLVLALMVSCAWANPFARLDWIPAEGRGMIPRLQNPLMALYQPTLYFGYAATSVPFAIAVAQFLSRRADRDLRRTMKSLMHAAWLLITVAIVLGMRWAYVEPASSAQWIWTPFRNASLLPWLACTAFLGVTASQEKRGAVRTWTDSVAVAAFLLSLFAVVAARGELLSNGDAVSLTSAVASMIAIVVVIVAFAYAANARLGDGRLADYGAAATSRLGARVAQAGSAIMLAAFVALSLGRDFEVSLKPGGSRSLTDPFGSTWTVVSEGLSQYTILNRQVTALALDLSNGGKPAGVVTTEIRRHFDSRGSRTSAPSVESGIRGSWKQDVHVAMTGLEEDGTAHVRVAFNPFVRWVWIGGALMALGGLIAMWQYLTVGNSAMMERDG